MMVTVVEFKPEPFSHSQQYRVDVGAFIKQVAKCKVDQ